MEKYLYKPNFTGMTVPQNISTEQTNETPMQGINAQTIQQNVQDSYVANRASQLAEINPMLQAGVSIPIWIGLCQSMDAFAKACRGDYKDTIQYKITNAGDVITDKFNGSKLGKSNFVNWLNKTFTNLKTSLNSTIDRRSAILRAMRDTPSIPEMEMVRGQANGMKGIQLFDYPQIQNKFLESVKHVEDLDCYGADNQFINNVKALIKSNPKDKAKIIENAEFELLDRKNYGVSSNTLNRFKGLAEKERLNILQDMKARALGYKDLAHWKSIEKGIQEKIPDVIEALNKSDKTMFTRMWDHNNNIIGKAQGWLFGRKVYSSEYLNKLLAELGNKKGDAKLSNVLASTNLNMNLPKSALGKWFGKYVNLMLEASTNRVAGGKLVAMMQAYFLAEAVIRTVQADKGDKLSTFMERFIQLIAFFACMPLSIQVMHKIGGLQYIGMNKDAVANYRNLLAKFNDDVKAGKLINKADYKTEFDALKNLQKDAYKGVNKNIFTRIAHKIGQLMTIGLEQVRPYTKHAAEEGLMGKLKNVFRNPKYWSKEFGGSAIRFLACMLMILPFISKYCVKASHLLFGKPRNSVLDEGKTDKTKTPEKQPTPEEQLAQLNQLQAAIDEANKKQLTPEQKAQVDKLQELVNQAKGSIAPQSVTTSTTTSSNNSDTNLLDKYKQNPSQTTTTTTTTTSTVPQVPQDAEPVRTYMPSPTPAPVSDGEDTSAADKALKNADATEKMIMQTLAVK